MATKLWGLKLHLVMNITKAQKLGDDQLVKIEPDGQEGVNAGTSWCIHASIDGEPLLEPHHRSLDSPRSSRSGAKIKEKAHALLNQATDPPGYTPMPRPVFV